MNFENLPLEYALLIGMVLIIPILLFNVFRPLLGFFLLILLRILADPLCKYSFGTVGVNAGGSFGIFIVLLLTFYFLIRPNFKINLPMIRWFYVFMGTCIFSFYNADDHLLFFAHFLKLLACVALYLIVFNLIESKKQGLVALRSFVAISIIPLIIGFWQIITGKAKHSVVHIGVAFDRIYSTFAHPNQYAFFLGLVTIAIFTLIQYDSSHKRLYLPFLGFVLASILLTFSRSVWLTITLCAILAFILNKKIRLWLMIAGLAIALLSGTLLMKRLDDVITQKEAKTSSLDFRKDMTESLFKNAFPQHPIIGFGLGSAMNVVRKTTHYQTVPHNDYMKILVETGVLGLVTFSSFLIAICFFLLKGIGQIRKNAMYSGLMLNVVYCTVIIIATNHFGNISTFGVWFCLLGIFHKNILLEAESKAMQEGEI